MFIPENHMSSNPGTVYGELLHEKRPYDPALYPPAVWANLPKDSTKVDLQFDDAYSTEALHLLKQLGIALPDGYRGMDVRHAGDEFSMKGYVYVEPNASMDALRAALPKNMGRAPSHGIREQANGGIRIGCIHFAICALKLGYLFHNRCNPSVYQRAEILEAHAPEDMYGNKRTDAVSVDIAGKVTLCL